MKKLTTQFILYALMGAIGVASDFTVYTLLIWSRVEPIIANVVGVTCGITVSFLLNRKFTFKVLDTPTTRFLRFYVVGISGLILSTVLLKLFIEILTKNALIPQPLVALGAKLLTLPIILVYQFTLNKLWSFKR